MRWSKTPQPRARPDVAMAKTKKATKAKAGLPKTKKAGKPAATKDRTGKAPTTAGAGDSCNTLPEPQISVSDLQVLRTLIEETGRQQLVEMQRLLQEDRDQRAAQAPVPLSPSPNDAAFAQLPEFMSDMRARLSRIEAAQQQPQQPARDPSPDVPTSVTELRRFFAGACKTLAIHQPTPAILGRIMHDRGIFSPDTAASPRNLFELIYAKTNIPDHLSQHIRVLLGQYGNPQPGDDNTPARGNLPADQQQPPAARKKRTSASLAKQLGPEFDKRFDLIVNTRCGDREPVRRGGKTNYHRYLNARGRDLFNEWPDWADATGGIRFEDEMPSPAAPPAAAEPTPPPPQPPT
jgi:hypothetical protein